MRGLIIGQGIAGTVLAWTLLQRGVQIQIADAGFPHSSSSIAAGIINPVTGKRFVKSWRFDELYPFAKTAYKKMEAALGASIWRDQHILRLLGSPQEINDWSLRLSEPEYADVLGETTTAGNWSAMLAPGFSFGEIKNAAQINFPVLLEKFKNLAVSQDLFLQKKIGPELILSTATDYDFIVFCEGYRASENPLFPNLPWQPSKGEALILEIAHPHAEAARQMVKKTLTLVPIAGNKCWAGASYAWDFDDTGATEDVQIELEKRLAEMLQVPYKIVQRLGAIRPTVKDRRPFLGQSPVQSNVFIFNGLGTKGALLAPYWAAHLADHLLEGKQLDAAVDISRFS
jgi:glycine/D-amino acid oxidase-like deaminating enzyme